MMGAATTYTCIAQARLLAVLYGRYGSLVGTFVHLSARSNVNRESNTTVMAGARPLSCLQQWDHYRGGGCLSRN